MRISLINFYFQGVLSIVVLIFIIYFVFILKEPSVEDKSNIKHLFVLIRKWVTKIILKYILLYTVVMFIGLLIMTLRDIPYIVNNSPLTATVETLMGNPSGTKNNSVLVRDISTGEVYEIKVNKSPVIVGEVYDIRYLPNTKWASLILISD